MFLSLFLLDIFFIYISNVIPSPFPPPQKRLSHSNSTCFYEVVPPPIKPIPSPCPHINLPRGIEPSQGGPLHPLMPDKVILCYLCGWSHGSLHMYSLVGGLVTGSSGESSSGVSGWLILLFFLWGCKPLQLH